MKVTAIGRLTMEDHAKNTITPYSIPGNSNHPMPIVYHNTINKAKAEIRRVKLTGCIKLSHRQTHVTSIPELSDGDIKPDIRFVFRG